MSEKKVCVNCPGATDHSTAECPMRASSAEVEAVEVPCFVWSADGMHPETSGTWIRHDWLRVIREQHQRIVAAKDAEIARLNAHVELLSGPDETVTSARGDKLFTFMSKDPCRYRLCEVTYAAPVRKLIAERDELRAQLAAQPAAVPVGICDSMMLSGEVCKLPAGHDGPCGYYAPAAPQQGELEELRKDAGRWRAFINCARIKFFGWAGYTNPDPNGNDPKNYRHFGAEFWTIHDAPTSDKDQARTILNGFADAAVNELARLNADLSAQGEKP